MNRLPWNVSTVTNVLKEIQQSRLVLLESLKELLDNYHGESCNLVYYDLLACAWLEPFTHLVYGHARGVGWQHTKGSYLYTCICRSRGC